MKTFLFMVLVLIGNFALADSYLHLGGKSFHTYDFEECDPACKVEDFNEENWMVGYEHKGYYAGVYRNSFKHITAFALKTVTETQYGDFNVRLNAGIAYGGYRKCPARIDVGDGICPVVIPELIYTKYRAQPSVGIMGRVITLSVRVKI